MSDVTPEEIYSAATIVNRLIRSPHVATSDRSSALIDADIVLRQVAFSIESEQAADALAQAKRYELIERLFDDRQLGLSMRQAILIADRYPALLES